MSTATSEVSLTDVTSGTGSVLDWGEAKSGITMYVTVSGTVLLGAVAMDVSHNGTDWVTHGTATSLLTGVNQKVSCIGEAVRYVRARVSVNITGGGSVSAHFMESD